MSKTPVERPWLYDKSYEFWLNVGVTRTAHPHYNCLWCINEELKVIAVMAPRKLIISALDLGAQFYRRFSYSQVGLAFIRHIQNDCDSSFLVPIMYTSDEQTNLLDELTKAVVRHPNQVSALFNTIKKSEQHRESLKTLINRQEIYGYSAYEYKNSAVGLTIPLKRVTNWRRVNSSESDYKGAQPMFWYTYENSELRLDFGFTYRMELRALLHKPSLGGFIAAPIMLLLVLGHLAYRFFSEKLLNRTVSRK